MLQLLTEVEEAKLTAAHAYDYWATLVRYGQDFDGTPIDVDEATAAAIGWASRDQNDVIA